MFSSVQLSSLTLAVIASFGLSVSIIAWILPKPRLWFWQLMIYAGIILISTASIISGIILAFERLEIVSETGLLTIPIPIASVLLISAALLKIKRLYAEMRDGQIQHEEATKLKAA